MSAAGSKLLDSGARRPSSTMASPRGPLRRAAARSPGSGGRAPAPLHLAIIMDGNGRWATDRGLPRVAGHQEGARAVREVVKAALAASRPIGTLTLYAFSADNWQRPVGEVCALMRLFERFLRAQAPAAVRERVRVTLIGRRDRLSESLARGDRRRRAAHARGRAPARAARHRLLGPRGDLAGRAPSGGDAGVSREAFEALVASGRGEPLATPPVDLLVRTGGEQRLSDFLLWECAYAELCFLPVLWPDFTAGDLDRALAAFGRRERRFGRVLACVTRARQTSRARKPAPKRLTPVRAFRE